MMLPSQQHDHHHGLVESKLRARDREKLVKRRSWLLSCILVSMATFIFIGFFLLLSSLHALAAAASEHALSSSGSQHRSDNEMPTTVPVNAHLIESITSALSVPMKCPTSLRLHPRHSDEYVNSARRRYLNSEIRADTPEITEHEVSRVPLLTNHDDSDQRSATIQLVPEMDCSASAVDQDLAQLLQSGAAPGVDVVYTYVDGTDPEWRQLLEATARLQPVEIKLNEFGNRYREWGELKYSMRSISRYAPFVRNIYVVVSSPSQVPSWLNQTHSRIRIVYHHELFEDPKSQLPTFNSLAIESVLHRIRGLSRHFLYMNNDVFVNSDLSLSDFITRQSYHQFQDWNFSPLAFLYNINTEACFIKLDFEFEAPPTDGNADAYFLRLDKRIDEFMRIAEQNQCFDDGKILFYLDRFLMYKLYGVQRRFWAAHVPHLWERCAMYELDRSPLAPFLHRVRRNPFRNPRRDISMHLQYEGLLLSRWDKIRYASRSIEQWRHDVLDADETEQSSWTLLQFNNRTKTDMTSLIIPPVRSVYRLSTESLNQDLQTPFYMFELFDDHNLVKGFGLAWHRNLRLTLAKHQTKFVCIDDDLKQLNNPALLVAQRRALLETFQCVWPNPAEWEIE